MSKHTQPKDLLDMDYINSLPQPLWVNTGNWWPVFDIEVQTGLLRIDVCGMLDVLKFSEVSGVRDGSGKEHDTDDFYTDSERASLPEQPMREPLTPNEAAGLPEPDIKFPGPCGPVVGYTVDHTKSLIAQATQAASPKQAEPRVRYLLNGMRFKFSFIDHDCPQCGEFVGTYPMCFGGLEEKLDQQWVALVPAADDQHLTIPQQAVSAQELSDEQIAALHKEHRENGWQDGAGPNEFKEIVRAVLAAARAQQAPAVESQAIGAEGQWQPIETAPKDGTSIVGLCNHEADPYYEGGPDIESTRLTNYGARVEGMSHVEDGLHVVVWEDDYEVTDGWENPSYRMPGGWTLSHDPEVMANPTHWMPLPAPPDRAATPAGEGA